MSSEAFVRGTRAAAAVAITLLALATHALAQVRPIRGTVTDEQGRPVAGAAIEVTSISESIVGFVVREQRRSGGRTWQASSSENGDYVVGVSTSGIYLVTASREGVGTDETQIIVELDGVPNVNLRLRKATSARIGGQECAGAAVSALDESTARANAGHPSLARLLRWLEAVELHTPGCGDSPVIEIGRWSPAHLETLLGDIINLSTFLRWARERPDESSAEARSSIESLTGGTRRPSDVRFVRDPNRVASILLYNRRYTLEEIEALFHGNETLRRGSVLHADIATLVPGNFIQYPVVDDGRRKGGRRGTVHWQIGRQLLDTITPGPAGDAGALLWYRAVSAFLFREGHLAEVARHLDKARQVFPDQALVLLDSAYLHLELSSPAIQAAVQEIRAEGADVAVDSRRNELRRAERFLRGSLALAPDDAEARLRLGHTLGELAQHEDAAVELRRAIAAKPDARQQYLAALFLGRQEHALGNRAEAQRRYENAAALFANAQSPRLALGHLARQSGDRAAAHRALRTVTDSTASDDDRDDPWLHYYKPHLEDAEPLMQEMRKQLGAGSR